MQQAEQVDAVTARVLAVLGDDIVAMYLYGSAVAGGLRPHSDLDFFVVTPKRLSDEVRRALMKALSPVSARGQRPQAWRPVELTSVAMADLLPWHYPPVMDLQLGEWLRAELDAGNIAPAEPNADLAVLIAMVREYGIQLVGPPPGDVLPEVPTEDLRQAMFDVIDDLHADLDEDTANVLLTLARIWSSLATGEIRSKDAAADWAIERVSPAHRSVLERARAVYLGSADDSWVDVRDRLRPAVDELIAEVRRS